MKKLLPLILVLGFSFFLLFQSGETTALVLEEGMTFEPSGTNTTYIINQTLTLEDNVSLSSDALYLDSNYFRIKIIEGNGSINVYINKYQLGTNTNITIDVNTTGEVEQVLFQYGGLPNQKLELLIDNTQISTFTPNYGAYAFLHSSWTNHSFILRKYTAPTTNDTDDSNDEGTTGTTDEDKVVDTPGFKLIALLVAIFGMMIIIKSRKEK